MKVSKTPLRVFCSFAQEDADLCIQLHDQLRPLEREGILTLWHQRLITAGTDWTKAADEQLSGASIILLLISPAFFASDYCYGVEMQKAMQQHEAGKARVIPLLIRPVNWQNAPFSQLAVLPTNKEPVTSWRNRDAAFANIVAGIHRVALELTQASQPGPHSPPPHVREEIRDYTSYIEEKTRDFVGRDFIFDKIEKFIRGDQKKGYFIIEGQPGAGKTSLAAQLVKTQGYIHHFNIRSEGIKLTDLFLRNICAQLIAKYELERNLPTSSQLRDNGYLLVLLQDISNKLIAKNEKAIIVVDALDEVDDTTLASGATVLYLPSIERLPDHTYIVATVRHNAPVKLPSVDYPPFYIEPNSPENRADIRKYIEQTLIYPGIQTYISSQGITKDAFIDLLEDKSEGNFMYLRYILPDIENGVYNDMKFEALPRRLEGYYEDHWQRMHGMDDKEWFRYKLPVLMALAAAEAPVTIGMIQAFSGVRDSVRIAALLEKGQWGQFLYSEKAPGSTHVRYSIYHGSFREFLAKKEEVKEAGVNFLEAKIRINTFYKSKLIRRGDK